MTSVISRENENHYSICILSNALEPVILKILLGRFKFNLLSFNNSFPSSSNFFVLPDDPSEIIPLQT